MSVNNVKAFFQKMEEDEQFKNEIMNIEKKFKNDGEAMLKAISEKGYSFTSEDYTNVMKNMDELSEADLDKVAGGTSQQQCPVMANSCFVIAANAPSQSEIDRIMKGLASGAK